jgi:flagellar assembly factor FliW
MTIANIAYKSDMIRSESTRITVRTTRFGDLEVDEELIIDMPDGLIGFERCRRFVVITPGEESAFRWFQSLDDGAVAFPIIEPWHFMEDYAPTISDMDVRLLGLSQEVPRLVFAVVTVPKHDPRSMTANLLAPLVINAGTRQGRQVIATDDRYTTRHRILQEMQARSAASSQ